MLSVDALDDLRLARPERDARPFARQQVRERRAPGASPQDADLRHEPSTPQVATPFRVRKRCSVPASRRRMFPRCEYTISSARATLAQKVYGVPGRVNRTHTGNSATAAIELTETYPDTQSSAAHTTADSAMASGARARNIPVAVATPLPPLNRT